MSSLLSFSTWAEEVVNGHWHAISWLASSIWKCHLLKKLNRDKTQEILKSPTCSHISMLSLLSGFPDSNETVNVKEFLRA